MGEQRQRFNEEFKQQTVKYIQEQTKSMPEIAEELNIPVKTLHQWKAKYRTFGSEPVASAEKIRELEQLLQDKERELLAKDQQLADAEEQLAIVKKAVHIFSKPRK
ncbi:transposase [Paenibacillus hemerocallicola]|uniref:Transposase n=1 Tax=Paenibacillus hemerocallicola TaxID=1172614 RepID=A0A5C4SUM0_9BACL|nr:transposase [Paenibacillus hemerocallicola]TNJ52771.1 transposase [Paenibacillus hemerocallicola]